MHESRRRRFSLTRHNGALWCIPAFGLLLICAVWVGTWLQFSSTERMLLSAAVRDTEVLAIAFEQNTRRVIRDADRLARLVKHEYENHDSLDIGELVHDGLVDGSGLAVVSVVNPLGVSIASSQDAATVNVADHEYFKVHASRDTDTLEISKPVASDTSGTQAISLSRRINHRDGSFAGLVSVNVPPDYFMQYYAASELGRGMDLGLLGMDGAFRARRAGGGVSAPADDNSADLLARVKVNPSGYFEDRDLDGQVKRIVAYRKLADYPFVVTVARSTNEVFASLYESRDRYVYVALSITFAIAMFFGVVTVLAWRLQRHRMELKTQRAFLNTLVDNVPSGISVRSVRPENYGQYILWNESASLIFGVDAKDALGKTVSDVAPGNYAEEIEELDRKLLDSPMVQDFVQVQDLPGGRRYYH